MNSTTPPGKDKESTAEGRDAPTTRPLPADARVLILRFSSLGDVVKATALPRQIKVFYPEARVTMVTSDEHLPLIEANPHLYRAIGFRRGTGLAGLRRLARDLRGENFHLVADVHRSLRSRLLAWWIGAPRTAYSKRTLQRWLLMGFRINTYRPPRRKEEDFLAALAPYGVRDDGGGTEISLDPVEEDATFPQRFGAPLARLDSWKARGVPVLGVAPVAAWDLKRWPIGHFRDLISRFLAASGGGVVVFGGKGDHEAAQLAGEFAQGAISLVGQTSLLESAKFASLTDILISNDTGMGHIAEAVGTDVIVLFGPTAREWGYFPNRPGSHVMEREMPCRPCTRMGEGSCTHPLPKACLVTISPESALEAVMERIGRRGA